MTESFEFNITVDVLGQTISDLCNWIWRRHRYTFSKHWLPTGFQ